MSRGRTLAVTWFIALALAIAFFFQVRTLAFGNYENNITGYDFVGGSKFGQGHLSTILQTRAAGYWLSGKLLNAVAGRAGNVTTKQYANTFGFYHAAWLLATFGVLIAFVKKPVFGILGTAAALSFYLVAPASSEPYDLATMFFFTLAWLLWRHGWFECMMAVIVLSTAFKETTALIALLFFFVPPAVANGDSGVHVPGGLNWPQKAGYFAATAMGCVLLRLWLTHSGTGHCQIYTAQNNLDWPHVKGIFVAWHGDLFLLRNWVWFNGGLLFLSLFLLPMKTVADKGVKLVLALFMAGQLAGGDFTAPRDFIEVIPVCLIYLQNSLEL